LKGFFDADADGEKSLNATMVLRGAAPYLNLLMLKIQNFGKYWFKIKCRILN